MVKSLRNGINSVGRTAILVLIYFLFLYTFQVPGLPFGSFMTALCALTIYTVYAFIFGKFRLERSRTAQMVRSYLLWNVFLLIYVLCLFLLFGSGNGTTPMKEYIQMMLILPIFYISGNLVIRNMEELMKILYIGVVIQSIIIIAALFMPVLSIGLTLLFPEGAYNTDKMGGFEQAINYGYKVGLGVFSSMGCLKMAIGQIGACYFLIKCRGPKLFLHLVIYLLIAVATTAVARTGMLISAVGLFSVFIAKKKQGGHRAVGFVLLLLFLLFIGYFFITAYFSTDFLGNTFVRLVRTFDNGIYASYFEDYSGESGHNVIPPICFETVIGLGITYGTSGSGITTITDGGFMRNYSAMGLIVAIINYLILAIIFIKQYKMCKYFIYRGVILFMSFMFLIGEFKEYYIYYFSPICFAFLIFNLIERSEMQSYLFRKKIGN